MPQNPTRWLPGGRDLCAPAQWFTGWDERWKNGLEWRREARFRLLFETTKTGTLTKKDFSSQWPPIHTFHWRFCSWRRWGLASAPLALAWLWARAFRRQSRTLVKNAIYECGLVSKGDAWVQFRSAYYLYAIIFLIFDVEAVFLLPFAVAFTGLGAAACAAMLVFVLC